MTKEQKKIQMFEFQNSIRFCSDFLFNFLQNKSLDLLCLEAGECCKFSRRDSPGLPGQELAWPTEKCSDFEAKLIRD